MPRYLVKSSTQLPPLQEGDFPQPLAFIVPDVLPMTDKGAVFTMTYKDGTVLFEKSSEQGSIIIDGQGIVINLVEADTKDKAGIYHWVLKVVDEDELLITIGYGNIQINNID